MPSCTATIAGTSTGGSMNSGRHRSRNRPEDVAAAEVQRQPLPAAFDVIEVDACLELVGAGEITDGVDRLVSNVRPRLRRKALPPHAGDAEHLERRPALVLERTWSTAFRIERGHTLIATRSLESDFVHHPGGANRQVRKREHAIVAVEHASAAPGDVAAKGLDVLVEVTRPVDARGHGIVHVHLMVELAEKLVRPDVVRHMPRLDGETRPPENRGRRSEREPEKGHIGRIVDGHEVVGGDVEPLERKEVERPVAPQRATQRAAELFLGVRRLVAIDRELGRIETLEMIFRVQRIVAEKQEQVACRSCSCRSS